MLDLYASMFSLLRGLPIPSCLACIKVLRLFQITTQTLEPFSDIPETSGLLLV